MYVDHGYTTTKICGDCGALIATSHQDAHTRFHERLAQPPVYVVPAGPSPGPYSPAWQGPYNPGRITCAANASTPTDG